eukprot:CAMPEP_0185843000 /NCGR_PEP_ID=MMETSP1353-20130828/18692_1 /TAXON_ID=1077150 /ORGANISM="Erythrolobus australicus, Strain CCMP3124" /LENGTH=145 /DNA_ID=CAMNT_0028542511 /DNA_START=433 /DNA_END=871 /DNA_ORIENTATION=+
MAKSSSPPQPLARKKRLKHNQTLSGGSAQARTSRRLLGATNTLTICAQLRGRLLSRSALPSPSSPSSAPYSSAFFDFVAGTMPRRARPPRLLRAILRCHSCSTPSPLCAQNAHLRSPPSLRRDFNNLSFLVCAEDEAELRIRDAR